MKILFLTLIVPYPPDAGPRIKTFHVLRYLSENGYSITLLTYVRKEEEKYLSYLHQICERVIAIPIQRSKIRDVFALAKSLIADSPFIIERDSRPAMIKTAKELLKQERFDVIHIDQVNMAQFILDNNSPPSSFKTIFDAHNATWSILERMRTTTPSLLKPIIALEAKKLRNYENRIVQKVDHVLTVTENDRQLLIENPDDKNLRSKFHVIPIAVNTQELRPVERKEGTNHILTIGSLGYPPNADGIRWFLRDIFPEIKRQKPKATLTVIGKNPPKDFFSLASPFGNSIHITGYVEDLTPFLENSALVVVPVLAGSGMRVRILEAFSRGIPVVTTSIGLEGITAENNRDVIVKDNAIEFASAVVSLLDNPAEQRRLALNARNMVTSFYDWKTVLQELDKVYQI